MRSLKSELFKHGFRPVRRERNRKNTKGARGRHQELLTDRYWAELMGVNRPTYGKVIGRVKQR